MRYSLHESDTGSFQELVRSKDLEEFGQLSMLIVNPRCSRGGHYHTRKKEWFCCVRGECHIVICDTAGKQTRSITLNEKAMEFVLVAPMEVHTVLNSSDAPCGLLVITSEEYDPDDVDTYLPEK